MEDFRVRMSFSAGRREAGQAATKAQAILGLVCAGFAAALAGAPASAQVLDRAAWVQAPPERHAEVLVAVVSHLLTEGAEILQGRCPLGPLSPDCDATPAPSRGQALVAEAGQGTIVLTADPNRHLGGAQFEDLDEREPDAVAAAVARR